MKKGVKKISASNSLAFYLDTNNIANQELVRSVINHIKTTRKDIFTPLVFLNLIWKQKEFVLENSNNPIEVKKALLALPLNEKEKHILYFFIICWYGGINAQLNPKFAHTLLLIENEFKKHKNNTPEKDIYFSNKHQYEKLTFQQIAKIKSSFDKLPYSEKLVFWDKFFNDVHYMFSSVGIYRENEIEENWGTRTPVPPASRISVFPNSKAETELYNYWLLNHIQANSANKHCNIEKLKEKYFETIKGNPRVKEFIQQEIETINNRRDKEKRLMEGKSDMAFWGYYSGYQSVVKNENTYLNLSAEDFKRIVENYAKGIADAYYLGFLEEQLEQSGKTNTGQPIETKADKLKLVLGKYGFFDLPSVTPLVSESKEKLIEMISSKGLPYTIAMFDYLGFITHLEKKYFTRSKYSLNKEISNWLNSDREGRAVKGNISSLLKKTNENKDRYTAYQHKETVQKDYQSLK